MVIPPLHGALLKNEQDVHLFERLAFMNRRGESRCWGRRCSAEANVRRSRRRGADLDSDSC